jgi:hypothetical protein
MKYTNKGNSNVGIQIEWTTGNMISEYTSKQMDLAIRFDEPTDEEKQIYPALKKKVKTLGNRKKQKRGLKAAVGAPPKKELNEVNEEILKWAKMKVGKKKHVEKKKKKPVSNKRNKVNDPIYKRKKRGKPNATTGLIGVVEAGKCYRAQVSIDGTQHRLGTFKTKEEAGIAYDEFVVDKSNETVTYVLNYPNKTDQESEENDGSTQKTRGKPNAATGLIGVYNAKEKYQVQVKIDGTNHHLGTFKTKKEAGVAYDRFVVGKRTKQVNYALNYPSAMDQESEGENEEDEEREY